MPPKILCIDDQAMGLQVRKIFLESFGYEVLLANSGRQGLDIIRKEPVDAVVLDYRMPEMDGEAVAREIRQILPQLPIVLLSGFISEIPSELHEQVNGFVAKGSPPEDLLTMLKNLVGTEPPRAKSALAMDETRRQAERAREHLGKSSTHLSQSRKVTRRNSEYLQDYKRRQGG